jgi:hypothetical protein
MSPQTFFLASVSNTEKENRILNITFDVFRYVLWQYKLEKKIPNYTTFVIEMNYQMAIIIATSVRFNDVLTDCKYFQNNDRQRRLPGVERRP